MIRRGLKVRLSRVVVGCGVVFGLSFPGAALADAQTGLVVTVAPVWVDSIALTGELRPIELAVTVAGAVGPLSWSVRGNNQFAGDAIVAFDCPVPVDAPPLVNGSQTVLACDNQEFRTTGPQV
ncbi:MAG: hypothetical protein LBH48_05060, partial [Bifidobacteriaceae bacterium]|nr:hypothetical protein [Bifidobacteriaceae bacterium]